MKCYAIDAYVLDVLMPDLVGHDRKPAAFLVYLCLVGAAERGNRPTVALSRQEIAVRTGLAKSTVQSAIRHLKRRGLLDPAVVASTAEPLRRRNRCDGFASRGFVEGRRKNGGRWPAAAASMTGGAYEYAGLKRCHAQRRGTFQSSLAPLSTARGGSTSLVSLSPATRYRAEIST